MSLSQQSTRGAQGSEPAVGEFDLLIVGGGINGAGIARDAAGRGLRALLCERGDLAQGTSSRSSRLIHGGLRYLELGEFRLVHEALGERETLMGIAPHLVRPLRFVLPHLAHMRPAWMLRAGLFLYDAMARRSRLPASQSVALDRIAAGACVAPGIRRGFLYSDCSTDDARLVAVNAVDAARRGARVCTRTEMIEARRSADGRWQVRLRDARGAILSCTARALVNSAGPWVREVGARVEGVRPRRGAVLVKGSHIVVPQFWSGEHAFLLQNPDRRVVFAMPYEMGFALIGTTDIPVADAPERPAVLAAEIDYLCEAVNRQMRCRLGPADVRHSFAGVRCLADDGRRNPSEVTRDYYLDVDWGAGGPAGAAPYIAVLGGKITTYRRLAEHVMQALAPAFADLAPAWTASRPLPGGELDGTDALAAQRHFEKEFGFLPPAHARGLFRRHGATARELAASAGSLAGMGRHFGAGLYEREVAYLVENEWASSAEDVLWRRTKCGLALTPGEVQALEDWLGHP